MFVRSPDGGNDFGYLPKEVSNTIRRQAGPIRLLESDLQHIEERHGDQIRQSGFESVEAFVASVVQKYNKIYQAGSGALTLRVHGMDRDRFAMIRLEPGIPDIENAEDYYAVKTASLCRKEYLQEKKPLLELDGPIQSSFENPFNPGTKVVTSPSENLLQSEDTVHASSEATRITVNDKTTLVNKHIAQNIKPQRYPWGDFPDVLRNGDLGTLKREPEYLAAKAGDEEAAFNLADRLICPDFVEAVRKMGAQHAHPVLLPVLAEESFGNNRIPLAFAENLSEQLCWDTETLVFQVTRSYRTGSGADHRLVIQPEFDGAINRDAGYILVDDTLTMGGTLASLRGYIQSHEGTVLGAAVGVAHEGALHLPIRESMLESIFSKHGQQATQAFAKEQWGYGIECLTQAEAGHIRKAISLDTLRDRFAQARDAGIQRMDEAGISSPLSEQDTNTQSLTDPARPTQDHHPPPLPETAMQDNRLMGFEKRDGDSVMETYQSRKYQVEDLGDDGLKVRVLMPNMEPEQLPTTDIPQGERAETIRREIAGTNMKDPMHKSAMDKMLDNALEQQEKLNDLAANLKSPIFEPRAPEKAEVAKEMASQAQNPEVRTPDQEEKAPEVRVMKMGPSVVRPSVEQQIESQNMTKEAPGKMNTVERPNYRPFAAHCADNLPEGFSSEVRVAALVVRDGTRMTPEMPMDGEDVKGWQVTRTFKQDHPSSEFADFPNDSKRITVESLTFDTQEEAIAAAKKMEKEPAELDRLYDAKLRSPSNTPERKEFLDNLITKNQQEIASRDWAEKSGLTPVEPSTYRPFVAQTPDVLPEGFAAQSWVRAVVVKDGSRVLAEKPQEGDRIVGWVAGRSLYRDARNSAYPEVKEFKAESLQFGTEEEATVAAQKMSREPISLETLNTIKEKGVGWKDDQAAHDLLGNLITEKQQEQEQPARNLQSDKTLEPEAREVAAKPIEKATEPDKSREPEKTPQVESAGDIAEDMKKMADRPIQAEPLFPQSEASPSPETSREQAPSPETRPQFARKQRPEVLMADKRGKPLIYDHGDKITVTRRAMIGLGSAARERREAVTEKSLLEARARFGEPVRFDGSPAFQMQTIAMAVKHGIELEPATPLGKKLYEKALEVDQSKNRLGPSEKTMNRPRERAKSPSKGMEL